jgi:hypothetical protein
MPPARRVRVLVIHIFCSPGRLAGHPSCTPANHHDEAVDTESQDAYYDDVHPPLHVDHDLSTSLPLPLAEGHTRTDQKVVATSSCRCVPDARVKSGTWRVRTDSLRCRLTCGAMVNEA